MPTRRRLRSEATGYPPPEEFKKMRYLPPPPRRRIPPPIPNGLEPYLDYDDAVQPLVDKLKAQGPLDRTDYLLLYRLASLRKADAKREHFHAEEANTESATARDVRDRDDTEVRRFVVHRTKHLRSRTISHRWLIQTS